MKPLPLSTAAAIFAGCLLVASPAFADIVPVDEPWGAESDTQSTVGFPSEPEEPSALPTGRIPGRYIVVFDDFVDNPSAVAAALGRQNGFVATHIYSVALNGFAAPMSEQAAQALALNPNVAYVEQDSYAQAIGTLVEGVDRIEADLNAMADIDGDNSPGLNVDIGIIDTGIDLHSDLNVHRFWNCIGGCTETAAFDNNGHGTHVSGSAAAKDDGYDLTVSGGIDYDVAGVAPGARLWGFKALGSGGSGAYSDIIDAIDKATSFAPGQTPTPAETIEVVNMSLGGLANQQALRQAIQASVAKGIVYVVAAGNESADVYGPDGVLNESSTMFCFGRNAQCDYSPAAYPEVMTVSGMVDTDGQPGGQGPSTSSGDDDRFYTSTNFSGSVHSSNPVVSPGLAIDVAAPGVRVLSTWWNPNTGDEGWAWGNGTSMASPHVAGAVALYILENNSPAVDAADVYAIRQALIDTAEPQTDWRAGQTTNDPDGNPEGLIKVAGGGGPQEPSPPTASFADDCTGLTCDFTDTSVDDGTIVSWSWDFGDGSPTSTDRNPQPHTYATNGTYVVSLMVTDNDGNPDTASRNVTVDGTPTASLSFSCTDLTCDFMDTSSDSDGTIVSRSWDFGDGNTSTEQNPPPHTYAAADTYTVSLTVTDNDGFSDSTSQQVTVNDPATGGITLDSVTPYKARGLKKVDLVWSSDNVGQVTILRDGNPLPDNTNDDGAYTDNIDTRGGGSYDYQVCEVDSGDCSNTLTASF